MAGTLGPTATRVPARARLVGIVWGANEGVAHGMFTRKEARGRCRAGCKCGAIFRGKRDDLDRSERGRRDLKRDSSKRVANAFDGFVARDARFRSVVPLNHSHRSQRSSTYKKTTDTKTNETACIPLLHRNRRPTPLARDVVGGAATEDPFPTSANCAPYPLPRDDPYG